jgi:hypothetical protein
MEGTDINVIRRTFTSNAGAICGAAVGAGTVISNCYNTGTIFLDGDWSFAIAGGITGNGEGVIRDCYNTGEVISLGRAGGIAGQHNGIIDNSFNAGDVSAENTAGGISGWQRGGAVRSSHNTGKVHSAINSGGISADSAGTIINCYNTGEISAYGGSSIDGAGGIVSRNTGDIRSSYNLGRINSAGRSVGGISGSNRGSIRYCRNEGEVISSSTHHSTYVGGISGDNDAGAIISDSFNTGSVSVYSGSAFANAGGVTGYNRQSEVINSYNTGDVSSSSTLASASVRVGGIVGSNIWVAAGNFSYWNSDAAQSVNGVSREAGGKQGVGESTNAAEDFTVPLTSEQMRQQHYFDGFDFENVWEFRDGENDGFPVLRQLDVFVIRALALPHGFIETEYSQSFDAISIVPATWSIDGGALPNGLSLSVDGLISGTPTEPGEFDFTVRASNGIDNDITRPFSITIKPERGYRLAIRAIGINFIIPGSAGVYTEGTVVPIAVYGNPGYTFVEWVSSNGGVFDDPGSPTTTFTIPANDVTLTAYLTIADEMRQTEIQMMQETNKHVMAHGGHPKMTTLGLQRGARIRAIELGERYSHTRPDGRRWDSIFFDMGMTALAPVAENIAGGGHFVPPAVVVQAWMDSTTGHRENILAPTAYIGAGQDAGWVQLFRGIAGAVITEIAVPTVRGTVGTRMEDLGAFLIVGFENPLAAPGYIPLISEMTPGYDPYKEGAQTVEVSFRSFTAEFEVTLSPPAIQRGDINGDEEIDDDDLTYLRRYLLGRDGYNYNPAMDVNDDGEVNAADLTFLRRHIAKLPGYDIPD